jgi:hypothetical protein
MKTGRSLTELAQVLEAQLSTRKDYLAPQSALTAKVLDGEVMLDGFNGNAVGINNHAHGQVADYLGIPTKYYNRMRAEKPDLLADSLNAWLADNPDEKRMVRTLDGKMRGFLSPKYRPLDNFNLAEAVLPVLVANKVQILSAELTDTRFYIKGILPELSEPLPEGLVWGSGHTDITRVAPGFQIPGEQMLQNLRGGRGRLVAAITISNSEVGAGTLRVEPGVFTTWCTNLAVLVKAMMRKYHVGRTWEADDNFEVFTDATRQADDQAFFMKVKDVTTAAFDPKAFAEAINSIREAGGRQIQSANLEKVVDATVRQLALPVSTGGGILSMLARGGDLSQWGLSSAITMAANTAESYELATALEYAGGQVLALPTQTWDTLSAAN